MIRPDQWSKRNAKATFKQVQGTRYRVQNSMRFEDLEVWKRSCRLCVEIYKALKECRDSGFKDQITRSALSTPSNIAEGYERGTNKDATKFFYYAKGSAGELRTQIYIGMEIGYIHKQTGLSWIQEAEEVSKMLSALIKIRKSAP